MKSKNYVYILPHKDEKTSAWKKNANSKLVVELSHNPLVHFILIFYISFRYRAKPIYIFRYLSDYNSTTKNILRVFSDILLILSTRILGGSSFWIAHNIDKETKVYCPRINEFRRKVVVSNSRKIFATDPLLIPYVREKFPQAKDKIGFTSFGGKISFESSIEPINYEIKRKLDEFPEGKRGLIRILCATALVRKCYHLKNIERLLDSLNNDGINVCMVFVARFDKEYLDLRERLKNRSDVLLFPDGGMVNEQFLSDSIDLVYRSLDDISVPYSVYNSVYAGIPVLTHRVGFTGDLVSQCKLGFVIEDVERLKFTDILEFLKNWNGEGFDEFRQTRSWEIGSSQLFQD